MFKLLMSDEVLPVNVGNPDEYSVSDIAKKVLELTGSNSSIEYHDFPTTDDPKQRRPVIERAKSILGWEPKVGLEEGLSNVIEGHSQRNFIVSTESASLYQPARESCQAALVIPCNAFRLVHHRQRTNPSSPYCVVDTSHFH